MTQEFQEFLPLFPIVAMGIFVSVIGIIAIIFERRAERKEKGQEQRRNAAIDGYVPGAGVQNTGHQLQQRAFAGSVLADHAEGLATPDVEAHVVERPEIPVKLQPVECDQLFQAVAGRVVDGVALRYAREFDCRGGHY